MGIFSATLKTVGFHTITATDTTTPSIDGTSNTITVVAGAAAQFEVTAPPAIGAGAPFNVFVTALDAFGNTATTYAGTVQLTSSDPQATFSPNATLTNGSGFFAGILRTAGIQTVIATDTTDTLITGTSNDILVSAGAAAHFQVTAPGSTNAGSTLTFTVVAQDQFNNTAASYTGTVQFEAPDDPIGNVPEDATLVGGAGTFSAVLFTAGPQTITASDTATPSINGTSNTIIVNAGAATHFTVSAPATTAAGANTPFTVTALDAFNNTAASYSGTVQFSSSDPSANFLPSNSILTGGVGGFTAIFETAGIRTLVATDTVNSIINGATSLVVTPGAATNFTVTGPANTVAGSAFGSLVTARDQFGNTASAYSGVVHFTSTDGQAVLPSNTTLTNGFGAFAIILRTAGNQTITATDIVSSAINGTSPTITVNAAAANHFGVTAPASSTAGNAFNFTVIAHDPFNNTVTSYAGTVQFSSSDPAVPLLGGSTLVGGVGLFPAVLKTSGFRTITATDTTTASIFGVSNPINVGAAAVSQFVVVALRTPLLVWRSTLA